MIGIGVRGEKLVRRGRGICELVVKGAFDVPEEVFDRFPVRFSGILRKTRKVAHSASNVWPGCNSKVEKRTYCLVIWHILHLPHFRQCLGPHFCAEMEARLHWSAHRIAVNESIALQDVKSILVLRDGEGMLYLVSLNFDS